MRNLFGVIVACLVGLWVVNSIHPLTWPLRATPSVAGVTPPPGSLRVSVGRATRTLAANSRSRRDLRCEATKPGVLCTFLGAGIIPGTLAADEVGNVLVWAGKDGRVHETNTAVPSVTVPAFRASAQAACAPRMAAVQSFPTMSSLDEVDRLIPIEQRYEYALVHAGTVYGRAGLATHDFFSRFLGYEQDLVVFRRQLVQQQPLNITQTDLGTVRGDAVGLTRVAAQIGVWCDFQKPYLEPPPAPTVRRTHSSPTPPRPTARADFRAARAAGFTVDQATRVLAANPNNRAIQCGLGTNGWIYICTFLNGAEPDRAGFVVNKADGSPLMVYLSPQGPVPAAPGPR